MDHPIYFASRKLSQDERNYTTKKREGLAMVYALQKLRSFKLGGHFKFFTDHSAVPSVRVKAVSKGQHCVKVSKQLG